MPPKSKPSGSAAAPASSSGGKGHGKGKPHAALPFAPPSHGRGAVVVNAPSNYYGVHTTRGAVAVNAAPAGRGSVSVRAAPTAEERHLFGPMRAWDAADRYGSEFTRPWRRSRYGGGRRTDDGRRHLISVDGLGQTTLDTAATLGWVAITLMAAGVYFAVTSDVRPNRRRRRR